MMMSVIPTFFFSCSMSFVKVFQDTEKIYQSCSSKQYKPYSYNGNSNNLTIHMFNTGFELNISISCKYIYIDLQHLYVRLYLILDNIRKIELKDDFHYTMKGKIIYHFFL